MSAYERIIHKLDDHDGAVRTNGVTAMARCPAHEDRDPSLSLRRIDGQILVHCLAGCDITDVLAGLDMGLSDLYDNPAGATYLYDDGRVAHRSPTKRFWQSGNTEGTGQLFHLAAVTQAVATDKIVFVVEGEKDVLAVESLGAVATTAPMGAGKWSRVDSSPLDGGRVVVVADKDDPGRRHAAEVVSSLTGRVRSIRLVCAHTGKDAADHVGAGHGVDDFVDIAAVADLATPAPAARRVTLTAASTIAVRPVHWLWKERIALSSLVLLGGREGIGKSTVGYWLAAAITRGQLPGVHAGQPKAVIVAATEDSWAHTIVPRLMAAGADLGRVYRVDVHTYDGLETELVLPRDLRALEQSVRDVDAALILLDPLMSRLDSTLDSHKDADVRRALEPLVALADRTNTAVVGIIHVNKSMSTDPLTTLMASRAFVAVARAVLFVMTDPDDDNTRLLGQPKNNLGRVDLPMLTFRIDSAHVADTEESPVWTGRVRWVGEREQSIHEAMEAAGESSDSRTATSEATGWLLDHLAERGGTDSSAAIKEAGRKVGHSREALRPAHKRLGATTEHSGFPRCTYWSLPVARPQSPPPSGESVATVLTVATGQTGQPVNTVAPVTTLGTSPQGAVATGAAATEAGAAPTDADAPTRCRHCQAALTSERAHGNDLCTSCDDALMARQPERVKR